MLIKLVRRIQCIAMHCFKIEGPQDASLLADHIVLTTHTVLQEEVEQHFSLRADAIDTELKNNLLISKRSGSL